MDVYSHMNHISGLQEMSNSSTMYICFASPTIPRTHSPWIPFTWTSVLLPYVCLLTPKDQFATFYSPTILCSQAEPNLATCSLPWT